MTIRKLTPRRHKSSASENKGGEGMYIAFPNEYDGDRAANSIELSTGERYTPEKEKPPVMPCLACRDKHLIAMGACRSGFGVCPA